MTELEQVLDRKCDFCDRRATIVLIRTESSIFKYKVEWLFLCDNHRQRRNIAKHFGLFDRPRKLNLNTRRLI